jgi:hypothetical protein
MGINTATNSDIINAVIGGLLISLSTSFHLLFKGRVTGMSGMITGLLTPEKSTFWKLSLFAGMILISSIFYLIPSTRDKYFANAVVNASGLDIVGFAIAGNINHFKILNRIYLSYLGLLVGIGT